MKKLKIIFVLSLITVLSGCLGAIQKQSKIDDQMKNFVFNEPAGKVYNTAAKYMNSMFIDIKNTGENAGASKWQTNNVTLGSNKYQEKLRFTVKVDAKGENKSALNISRERSTNMMGDWDKASAGRYLHYEYNVLKKINAAKAAEIDKKASK